MTIFSNDRVFKFDTNFKFYLIPSNVLNKISKNSKKTRLQVVIFLQVAKKKKFKVFYFLFFFFF